MAENPEVSPAELDKFLYVPAVGLCPDDGKLYPIKVGIGGSLVIGSGGSGGLVIDPATSGIAIFVHDGTNRVIAQAQVVGTSKAMKVFEASPAQFQRALNQMDWAALGSSYTQDDDDKEINIGKADTGANRYTALTLYCNYTKGTGATVMKVIVEFSPDGLTWYQESKGVDSGSGPVVRTEDIVEHSLPVVSGQYRVTIPAMDGLFRIKAKETGASSAGSLVVLALAGIV